MCVCSKTATIEPSDFVVIPDSCFLPQFFYSLIVCTLSHLMSLCCQLRLEQERKDRLKQKEKEKRLRRKMEGKPVTKKEKEAEAMRQAKLAALREQGE